MDEVRVYSRALSAAEVLETYLEYALVGDFDHSSVIDLSDFAILSSEWQNADNCDVDLTCDCRVDVDDLSVLVNEWLKSI